MFSTSTQKKQWLFESTEAINKFREKANKKIISKYDSVITEELRNGFLSPTEEALLCQLVLETGLRLTDSFRPQMPTSLVWTACCYFKRFFLRYSPMENSPKNIMMACLYLACKVDEFYVTIDQFVVNLKSGTPESNAESILSLEAVILSRMDYQLIIHCPFRPLEGHLIDMKTRMPEWGDYESLRQLSTSFLRQTLLGDAPFLYPPAQLALAALEYAANAQNNSLSQYIENVLLADDNEAATKLIARLQNVIETVKSVKHLNPEQSKQLQMRAQESANVKMILDEKINASGGAETDENDL